MKIKLQYFSQLRDVGGPSSLDVCSGVTVQELLDQLFALKPDLHCWDKHLLIAAGNDWVSRAYVLHENDMILLMPPVQGG
ncbi:MAG: MoaD/ThiS family protein [Verrucomicrobia bacterium]|nr:MoaD/ThiS family protein [Verrucomicrobiota bacterium]